MGPALAETLFDAGLRHATVQQFEGAYNQTVANYRQAVLTGFQQVEDNLAALRFLSQEIQQQDTAVKSAQRNLKVATDRYNWVRPVPQRDYSANPATLGSRDGRHSAQPANHLQRPAG